MKEKFWPFCIKILFFYALRPYGIVKNIARIIKQIFFRSKIQSGYCYSNLTFFSFGANAVYIRESLNGGFNVDFLHLFLRQPPKSI